MARINLDDFGPWAQDRLHEFSRLADSASTIINGYLPQVIGDNGVPGDPIQIAAVARRLAQVWEDSARWTLRCRAVRVDPGAERVVELLATMNANMLNEIWEFGHSLIPHLDEAIEGHTGDGPRVIKMTLTLTVDVDEFNEELARFGQSLAP